VLYLICFLGGLAGSLHCVGMCGIFPLGLAAAGVKTGTPRRDDAGPGRLGAAPGDWSNLRRQLLYNLGRLNALVFIGATSGAGGAALVAAGPVRSMERWLAVAAGVFMVLVGLETLGFLSGITARAAALTRSALRHLLGGVMASRSPAAPVALGVFNAFLPCSLIYAFAARAAATASIVEGSLTMLCFALGTVPAMLGLGVSGALMRPSLRARLATVAGVLVVSFGLVTLLRAVDAPCVLHVH